MWYRSDIPRVAFTLTLVAGLWACGPSGESSPPTWTTAVDTLPGGTVQVVHPPPGDGSDTTWVRVEVLRRGRGVDALSVRPGGAE